MGQLLFFIGSLLSCGGGIALYLSDHDGSHWMVRAIAAGLVVVAIAVADIGQRIYRDLLLAKMAALYALLFLGMAGYSLYLNIIN